MKALIIGMLSLFALPVSALPIAPVNLSFEAGLGDGVFSSSGLAVGAASSLINWNQYANSPGGVTTEQSSVRAVDGQYSARVIGDGNNGLYQYQTGDNGVYTASAWFYVVRGAAYLGLFYNTGNAGQFSTTAVADGTWQYLTNTFDLQFGLKGPVLYTAQDNTEFYIDALWINAGSISTSPWDPATGFNPNTVPEPFTLFLITAGLLLFAGARVRTLQLRRHRI